MFVTENRIKRGKTMKLKILRCILIILIVLLLCNCGFDQNEFIKLIKNSTSKEVQEAIDEGAKINKADEMGITPLMIATKYNEDSKIINILLKEGADVNSISNDKKTALMLAAENNNSEEIIMLLLQHGADTTLIDDTGNTALIMATHFNQNPTVIKILAQQGEKINHQNANGETALMIACQNRSNLDIIQSLIDAGSDLSIKDKQGETALIKAVKYFGTEEMIEYLIQNGANITVKDSKKKNLAILAIENSASTEILLLLLLRGVSVSEKDVFGKNALDYINKGTSVGAEQAKIIDSYADNFKSLFLEEIKTSDVESVKKYLAYGFNLNEKDKYKRTPLMIAAANNPNPDVIQLLIDFGARINLTDSDKFGFEKGETALAYAAKFNSNPEIIQVLIENGALVNEENKNGETPLMGAAKKNSNPECIKKLIENGANINHHNNDDETPLMLAARSNPELGITQELIDNGASVDDRDNKGKTALMHAIDNENPEITSALIKAGANVNAQDSSGYTPLFFAIANKQTTNHIPILIQAGADVKHLDDTGLTAYDEGKFNEAIKQTEGFQLLTATHYSDELYFYSAIREGETDIISLVLHKGELPQDLLNQGFIQALSKDMPYNLIWEFIEAGADINAQSADYHKTYPLITASENTKDPRIIELLLESGAKADKKDGDHHIALDYAKLNANLDDTKALQILADMTPVYTANFLNYFNSGDTYEIKRCLKSDQLTQDELNKGFIKALSMDMSYDLIRLFILAGVNTNVYDSETYPLIIAAKHTTDPEIIELLLDAGANPSKRDHSELTALDYAVKNVVVRQTESFKRLEEMSPVSVESFFECIVSEDINKIQTALNSGLPLNVRDSEALSPLMVAIQHTENKEIVELLIDRGVDLSQRDSLGQTALMMALKDNGNIEIIRFLLNETEDFYVVDQLQRNLLMAAVQNPVISFDILQLLIDKGIDVNARDKYGATVLHYVCQDVDKFRFLLDSGADVNLRRKNISPLLRAVSNNFDSKIVELLIKHGAEIDSVDYSQNQLGGFLDIDTSNKTPLMVAVEYQTNPVTIKLLIQSGADVNYINRETGQNILINAVQNHSDPQIIHWLLEAGAQPNVRNSEEHTALFYAEKNDYSQEILDEIKELIPYAMIIENNTTAYDKPGAGNNKVASFNINKKLEIVGRDWTKEWIKVYDSETNTYEWLPLYKDQLTLVRKNREFALLNYIPGNMLLYPTRFHKPYTYDQFLQSGEAIDGVFILEPFGEKTSDLLINNQLSQDVIVIISQNSQVEYSIYVKKHEQFYLNGIKAGIYQIGYWDFDYSNSSYWFLKVNEIPSKSKEGILEAGMAQEYKIYSYSYSY